MSQPTPAAVSFAGAVRAVVTEMLPVPMDVFGKVVSARFAPDGTPLTVTVSGPTEHPLICRRWSSWFDSELRSLKYRIEGRQVQLVWSDNQAVIAWTTVTGEADADE